MQSEKIFDYADPEHGVDVVAAISAEQVEAFLGVFPEFPRDRVVLSPNGYNQHVFRRLTEPTDVYADRAKVLAGFMTQPPEGSGRAPEPVAPPDGFDAVVAFCGKFADWKRLDALLRAAAIYEQRTDRGSSPWWSAPARSRPRCRCTTSPPSSACAGPTSSARGRRTSWPCCSTAPTSAASRPTASRSAWCSSSAWPAAPR